MVAVDTNLLVYAHRREAADHARAAEVVAGLARSPRWALPWPVAHEFVRIVTDGRIFRTPTPLDLALDFVRRLLATPGAYPLAETPDHWEQLAKLALAGTAGGSRIHDARIAALCLSHGVTELWTADRDFGRFPRLRTRNPLAIP